MYKGSTSPLWSVDWFGVALHVSSLIRYKEIEYIRLSVVDVRCLNDRLLWVIVWGRTASNVWKTFVKIIKMQCSLDAWRAVLKILFLGMVGLSSGKCRRNKIEFVIKSHTSVNTKWKWSFAALYIICSLQTSDRTVYIERLLRFDGVHYKVVNC